MAKKEIKVTCEGADRLIYNELEPYQGKLKSLSDNNYQKLKNLILKLGFSEPISIWKNRGKYHIVNGHQRLRVVAKMVKDEGYQCPPLPVNWIQAKSAKEAKKKVLALTSQFGKMENEGLYEFMSDADLGVSELDDFAFPEIKLDLFKKEYFEEGEDEEEDENDSQKGGGDPRFMVSVHCDDEAQMSELYHELMDRGFPCRMNA